MAVNGQNITLRDALTAALTVLAALAGLYIHGLEGMVGKLSERMEQDTAKLHAIETQVAAGYPTKDDLARSIGGVHARLDRIEDKLDARIGPISKPHN
ncbi:hypothetical protein [Methylomagnum ishizawai]|uniref:Uncharacterized protein n=1 Tax=Methylomagnum ishizawai TaxID=1760988 RepID=A0A1Y6CUU9_9GAMM|nr:hypothetical protein [Methylomagnum ishizawai]BBL73970.1 hypothetical protein MishRS11D_10680 [Methylomagnum ishizawai]SMF94429.1 hypothetical protein SAMN02949497_1744 [Methylomagnum ishizawai]